MRVAAIAIVFAMTVTAAASAASTAPADDPKHVAPAGAPVERSASQPSDPGPPNTVWYRDPITITLAIVGLFALIDVALLVTERRHRAGSRGLRQQHSDYRRA